MESLGRRLMGRRPWLGGVIGLAIPWRHALAVEPASGTAPRTGRRAKDAGPPATIVPQDEPAASQGQVWRDYDLRPYLQAVQGLEHPQQPLIDWILRETGTERWFGETSGMLSVEGEKLRVLHVPEVQTLVAEIVERYAKRELHGYAVSVRLVTVESVNWRALALPYMQPIRVDSPGVEAWLLTPEQAALLIGQLRQRVDVVEHNSAQVQIHHGQSHLLERWQPRSYARTLQWTPQRFPGYQIDRGEIREGYSLRLSPLMLADLRHVDVAIQCGVDQVERMSSVTVDVPASPVAANGRVQIEVPQIASWRLHERFRWPVDQVLLISRGVVAMPTSSGTESPLPRLWHAAPPRADALLLLECRRTGELARVPSEGAPSRVGRLNYHGRY